MAGHQAGVTTEPLDILTFEQLGDVRDALQALLDLGIANEEERPGLLSLQLRTDIQIANHPSTERKAS